MAKKKINDTQTKPAPHPTKMTKVIDLLRRKQGATLDELAKVTDWKPHSIRAALTGLRKKGHPIERSKRVDSTCYTIVGDRK